MTSAARRQGDLPLSCHTVGPSSLDSFHLDPSQAQLTCALFTCERQLVIARNVIPLALLVPDHHHAVFSGGEEVVRLVGPPVLKLLWVGMGKG